LDTAYRKLRPGSRIILETINAACWYAFFSSYIRDFTHAQPLHPETLQYLAAASGFRPVEIRYSAPGPHSTKLRPGAAADDPSPASSEIVSAFNRNVERLNSLLFTYYDYAVIGVRS